MASMSGARGATDITGFGFVGHAAEMIDAPRAKVHDVRERTVGGVMRLRSALVIGGALALLCLASVASSAPAAQSSRRLLTWG